VSAAQPITTLISDFGGVLTSPLLRSFAAFQDETGVPLEALGQAMQAIAVRDGENPLFVLERGEMSEPAFLTAVGDELETILGRPVDMRSFAERYFGSLTANDELIEHLRGLRNGGLRLAMLTNNVREWEPRWRAMLPVDELFELIVDSAFVGLRKPDPAIYRLTCERLGVATEQCLFLDDLEPNVEAARELGMAAVRFVDNAQAINAMDALLPTPSAR